MIFVSIVSEVGELVLGVTATPLTNQFLIFPQSTTWEQSEQQEETRHQQIWQLKTERSSDIKQPAVPPTGLPLTATTCTKGQQTEEDRRRLKEKQAWFHGATLSFHMQPAVLRSPSRFPSLNREGRLQHPAPAAISSHLSSTLTLHQSLPVWISSCTEAAWSPFHFFLVCSTAELREPFWRFVVRRAARKQTLSSHQAA